MRVKRLRIRDFRCFDHVRLTPAPGINLIVGDNASGKTSVLEAIYYLGRGQSFRQATARKAIRQGASAFTLDAVVNQAEGRPQELGVYRSQSAIHYRADDNKQATRLDLVTALPLQLIDPNVHRLLEQGPRYRRHFLDWGVFHVEHAFFSAWRRYRRALRQRNRALRQRLPKKDIIAWDAELAQNGETVDACRRGYIEFLRHELPESTRMILSGDPPVLEYHSGWRGHEGFGAALLASLSGDIKAGFTQQGPHRADLRVRVADTTARDWVSHGQQKVLTAALLLAQARLLKQRRNITPVLLLDDLAAELGATYRKTLFEEIVRLRGQCFLTCLDAGVIPDEIDVAATFHVEHGRIVPA